MRRMLRLALSLTVLVLAGCGAPSQSLHMTTAPAEALQVRGWVPAALQGQVGLAPVRGGDETGRWWGSKVSAQALQDALDGSLRAVGMRPAAPSPAPRFELRAELAALEQPVVPVAGVTVGVAVRYTLVETAGGRVLYQRRLVTQESAALSDAWLSPSERLRIANERALRANIAQLLRELVAVPL